MPGVRLPSLKKPMMKIIEDNESIYDSDREDWESLPTSTK